MLSKHFKVTIPTAQVTDNSTSVSSDDRSTIAIARMLTYTCQEDMLSGNVIIPLDKNDVAHLFSEGEHDLYYIKVDELEQMLEHTAELLHSAEQLTIFYFCPENIALDEIEASVAQILVCATEDCTVTFGACLEAQRTETELLVIVTHSDKD